jgi:hypothetical protein
MGTNTFKVHSPLTVQLFPRFTPYSKSLFCSVSTSRFRRGTPIFFARVAAVHVASPYFHASPRRGRMALVPPPAVITTLMEFSIGSLLMTSDGLIISLIKSTTLIPAIFELPARSVLVLGIVAESGRVRPRASVAIYIV